MNAVAWPSISLMTPFVTANVTVGLPDSMGLFWPGQKEARPSQLEITHMLVKGFNEAVVGCKQTV